MGLRASSAMGTPFALVNRVLGLTPSVKVLRSLKLACHTGYQF